MLYTNNVKSYRYSTLNIIFCFFVFFKVIITSEHKIILFKLFFKIIYIKNNLNNIIIYNITTSCPSG